VTRALALAALSLAAPAAAMAPDPQPVRLAIATADGRVSFAAIAAAATPARVAFTLDVASGTGGNVSHTRQAGHASLRPGHPDTLTRIVLAGTSAAGWQAVLDVTVEGGAAYRVTRRSGD